MFITVTLLLLLVAICYIHIHHRWHGGRVDSAFDSCSKDMGSNSRPKT